MLPQSECLYFTAIYATIACLCVGAGRAVPLSSPSILIQQQLRGSDDPRRNLQIDGSSGEDLDVVLLEALPIENLNRVMQRQQRRSFDIDNQRHHHPSIFDLAMMPPQKKNYQHIWRKVQMRMPIYSVGSANFGEAQSGEALKRSIGALAAAADSDSRVLRHQANSLYRLGK